MATRWYRAPELLLAAPEYDDRVDMWSVGCILAELIARKPFLMGMDSENQLVKIYDVVGSPTLEDLRDMKLPEHQISEIMKGPKRPKKSFKAIFPNADPDVLDLLQKLLTFNPEKRYNVEQALKHPYMASLSCPEDEVAPFDWFPL